MLFDILGIPWILDPLVSDFESRVVALYFRRELHILFLQLVVKHQNRDFLRLVAEKLSDTVGEWKYLQHKSVC